MHSAVPIRDESGRLVFLDLNPGGQWLFLPDMITNAVTAAIASFMVTGRS